MNLSQRFDALDNNLKLDPTQLERARTFHREMSDILTDAGVAVRTRLQGSLARGTMEPPLHDIDKVIELNPALEVDFTGPDGPERAMALVRDTLYPGLPGASFKVKKHALGITPADEDFGFDAVPAFATTGASRWIRIADTVNRRWEPSNTYELIDTVSARNQVCLGRFAHQVRMTKRAVSHAGLSPSLPGLHTETFCYNAITTAMSHPEAVASTLAAGADLLTRHYCEPTGVDRISDRLHPGVKGAAQQALAHLGERVAEATRLANTGDELGATAIWADLFGDDCFPRPGADERKFLAGLWAGGTVPAAAAGAAMRPRTPTTRAWRPW